MLICTYNQTIDVYIYNEKQEEFINIYTRVFEKSIFSMDNMYFDFYNNIEKDNLIILKRMER